MSFKTISISNRQERWNKDPLLSFIDSHIIDYPTPTNLTYLWSFGASAGICLVIQMISGIFLAMHYTPNLELAFDSVEHIMRDVCSGWLIRYIHANGASIFFIVVYLHIFRNLYFSSFLYPRHYLWMSGVAIFLVMMATGFMGYVLPWGQMSLWGATVITNLFSAFPIVGTSIVEWLWGGFSVGNPTLNRFFSLHYLLPFVIAGLTLVHLNLLHRNGSNNPLGIYTNAETVDFYPYFYIKDLFSILILIFVFSFFVFFAPNMLGHSDNYILGNPMSTPAHIVPEWYFLPFYAILRSIPDKLGGVLAMFGSILYLFTLPFINMSQNRSSYFRSFQTYTFWFIFLNFVLLGWIGQKPVESPYIEIGQISTFLYFALFLLSNFLLPLLETYLLNFNYKFFNTFHSDSFKFLKTLDSKEPFTLAKKYYNFSLFFTTYSKNEISYTMSDVSTNNAIFTDSLNIEKSTTWFDDYLSYNSKD
jgi:ubiquinol-cytochrome c reductase cytochrome b subunit